MYPTFDADGARGLRLRPGCRRHRSAATRHFADAGLDAFPRRDWTVFDWARGRGLPHAGERRRDDGRSDLARSADESRRAYAFGGPAHVRRHLERHRAAQAPGESLQAAPSLQSEHWPQRHSPNLRRRPTTCGRKRPISLLCRWTNGCRSHADRNNAPRVELGRAI